jgi:predicted nucleotidyltransferase
LLRKSNPALLEWLKSPVVYAQDEAFISELRALASSYYSASRCFYHYLHMAYGNARSYLAGEEIWSKKYLHVLRPILACRWIERGLGQVPMLFEKLVEAVVQESDVRAAIAGLLARKRAGDELARGPRDPVLSAFLAAEFPRLEALHFDKEAFGNEEALNRFFQEFCLGACLTSSCEG